MIIANFTTVKPEMAHSRTYEDFSKFLGENSKRLGIVSRMEPYEEMTMSYLTEAFGNVVRNKEKMGNKFQKLDSFSFEWEIQQNFVKYVFMAAPAEGDGTNGSEITMVFKERYYEPYDTFEICDTKQQFFVLDAPTRKADNYWCYTVRVLTNDREEILVDGSAYEGAKTRWLGNVQVEYHEQGYTKFQSNVEKARGYISEIRNDIDASSRYEAMEQTFIKLSRGSEANGWESKIFAWPDKKRVLLDSFMTARNNGMLLQHGTMDANGKATVTDRQGRPVMAGDGVLPQIYRYASKFNYSKLTVSLFNEMILALAQKCPKVQGNTFLFVVNLKLFQELQNVLSEYLANHNTDGAYIWSKQANGNIKVGATYDAYTFANNTIILKADRALDFEYPDTGFGVMIDLTADKTSGRPAIEAFTVEGKELIENTLTGVGIRNGEVASPVAGIKWTMTGYWGIAVYNPYRSVVLLEN